MVYLTKRPRLSQRLRGVKQTLPPPGVSIDIIDDESKEHAIPDDRSYAAAAAVLGS